MPGWAPKIGENEMHPSMPGPCPEHAVVRRFTGNWDADETMHPGPWDPVGGPRRATLECAAILGGQAITMDYKQRKDGEVLYAGFGVVGYDPGESCYAMHWFDVMSGAGMAPATRGTLQGNTLAFQQYFEPMSMHSRYVYEFDDASEHPSGFGFRIECSSDGKNWAPMLSGRYRRRA